MAVDWNAQYAQGETPWDKGFATPVLEEFASRHPGLLQGRILVPGCGIGHDARWLAAQGAKVVATDIAPLALEKARALDTGGTVDFRLVSSLDAPANLAGQFDLVWEHTFLSALKPSLRPTYASSLRQTLRPGGRVVGVYFINPEMDPGEEGPPFAISPKELEQMWQMEGLRLIDSWVPATGYPGRQGRELAVIFA